VVVWWLKNGVELLWQVPGTEGRAGEGQSVHVFKARKVGALGMI